MEHGDVYSSLMFTSIIHLPEMFYKSHNGFSFRCFIMLKSFLRSINFNRPRSFINCFVLCLFYHRTLPFGLLYFFIRHFTALRSFPKSFISFHFCPTQIHPSRNTSSVLLQFRIKLCYRHLLVLSVQPIPRTVITQDNTYT